MLVIKDLVEGPYLPGQEARFKADVIKVYESRRDGWTYLQVENEEKEPGFPDLLAVNANCYLMIEFKVSDMKGVVAFERSQPLFYKRHPDLRITILAWDVPRNRTVNITRQEAAAAKSLKIKIPEVLNNAD